MKKENKKKLYISIVMLIAFAIWTVLLLFIDRVPIGPNNSYVGLSSLNAFFHNLTGVHMTLYYLTDWLGIVPIFFVIGFAILGLIEWIKRKSIKYVDFSILTLGGFYIVVITIYLLFEEFVLNYRPVLINGYLEPSYPSSTTLLVMCIMPTAKMQLSERIKNKMFLKCILFFINFFTLFMVIGRLVSGVHWLSDIVGGILISIGLVKIYSFINSI